MKRLYQLFSKYIFPSNPASGTLGSIDLNFNLLQWFGLPLFASGHSVKASILVYGVLVLTIFRVPYHFFEVYDLVLCWGNFIQNSCMTFLHLGGSFKTILVLSRLEEVHKIVQQLKFMTREYVRTEKQKEVFFRLEFENKISFSVYAFMIWFSATSAMVLLFIYPSTFLGQMFPYRAKLPDWVPIIVQMFYVSLSVILIGVQIVGVDYLNVSFINLTRCQLQMLNISFDELNESVVGRVALDPMKQLKSLVKHHNTILNIRDQIESVFKYPMLVQFTVSLVIYGITGFQVLVRSDASGLVMIYFFLLCILAQLLVYCWFGNEVSEQNKTLALRGYGTTWYKFDVKYRKSLILFLMNAQRPLVFTAGGYVELSLMTFSRILSKSYTFVAVLRQQYTGK